MTHSSTSTFRNFLVLSILLCGSLFAQPGSHSDLLAVVVSEVEKVQEFGERLEALGTTRANESVEITANVTEFVKALHFDDGDVVNQGDLLVELDNQEEVAALNSALALLDERKAAFERAQNLVRDQAISTATLQEREASLRQVEGQIEGLRAQVNQREIRAPFDGQLGIREVSIGALIRSGQLITTLDDLSRIKVDFEVPSLFLSDLRSGLEIEGRVRAFPDKTFKGEIRTLGSRVDPRTRSLSVRALLPNPDGLLRPGLLMTIDLIKNPREALMVPESSIVQTGDEAAVYVIRKEEDADKAHRQTVRLGSREPGRVEVVEGLSEGDKVVVHGLMQIRDGQEVRILGVMKDNEPLEKFLDSPEG